MIQPDIDPAREPLVAQGVLRVAEAARGVLGDVHRMLSGGAVEEAFAGLLCCPGTLCGRAWRRPLRVRDAVLPAARSSGRPRRHTAGRRASAARRAACIRVCAAILAGVSLARRTTARRTCGA